MVDTTNIKEYRMTEVEIKPNDVMIVFRPTEVKSNEWDGSYSIFISAIAPLTLSEDDIGKLLSSAMMTAACAKLLEQDEELAKKAAKHCEDSFGDMDDAVAIPSMNVFDNEYIMEEDTPTVGGMQ